MAKSSTKEKNDNFIMLPIVDVCFDGLMHNDKIRKGIIASLLNKAPEEIESTELLPTHLRREYADDKLGIMDVRVKLKDETKINFEMQVAKFDLWSNRVVFYLSKMYIEQIERGDSYEELKKCIHVSILDFIHFPDDEKWYHKISFCDVETGKIYTDLMEIHVFELGKLPPESENEEGIIRWMRFFGSRSREELEEVAEKDEYIEEAYEELKKLSASQKKRIEYEQRQKAFRDHKWMMESAKRQAEAGIQQGLRQGFEQGEHAKLQSIVEKKLNRGMSVKEIAEFLEEDEALIEELARESKKHAD